VQATCSNVHVRNELAMCGEAAAGTVAQALRCLVAPSGHVKKP
jgi:hypothetical protein